MANVIYLQIGQRDRVSLNTFIQCLAQFLGILRDLDSTISNEKFGSVRWEVVSLRQNSPPVVGISPSPRSSKIQDFSETVEHQVLLNAELLTGGTEPNMYMSYSALQKLERLAGQTKTIGNHVIYTSANGSAKKEGVISEQTFENVQKLTSVKYSAYGSIIGSLDGIYVHKADEFRVWDENTGKPVKCKFDRKDEEEIKSLLRSRVVVSGMIMANQLGIPVVMDADSFREYKKRQLPSIEEMSGLVKGITEGKPLKQYLEDIADE